jgi:alkyl hydroperoxide reductase subunit AhpC
MSEDKLPEWVEVRDHRGHLAFRYDIANDVVEIKSRGVFVVAHLDAVRKQEAERKEVLIP